MRIDYPRGLFMSNIQNPFEISRGKHVMLLCDKDERRAEAAAHWINQGLDDEQLCIYASVFAFDQLHISNMANLFTKIENYQSHIDNNNLQIINFKPYYESALRGNLLPFENLKDNLEKLLHDRVVQGKENKIIVFADAACCLCENKSFDESEILEKWWQDVHNEWLKNNYHITVVCPHPHMILEQSKFDSKSKISNLHDLMMDLNEYDLNQLRTSFGQKNAMRILIVESEPDLMTLYAEYLSALDLDVIVVSDGNECLSVLKVNEFDIIILDMHLSGIIEVSDVAKEIYRIKPNQRIVLTTSNPLNRTVTTIDSLRVNKEDILVKPFMLSTLLEAIKRK